MSEVDVLLKATALGFGSAIQTTSPGIFQLNDRPLMLAMFAWPGEDATVAAIIASRYGEKVPRLSRAIPNARSRDDQYAFFLEIGDTLDAYFEECAAAGEFPQVVVSGASAVNHIHALAHRVLNLQTRVKGDESPDRLNTLRINGAVRERFGRPIGYWSQRANAAGQQIIVPATQMLTAIWATGQSQLEDQQIHSVRAWIDTTDQRPLELRLRIAERRAAGARSMPEFDNDVLEPVLNRWFAARKRNDSVAERKARAQVERRFLIHLLPQYNAIEWAICAVKARRKTSPAARLLSGDERDEFSSYVWAKANAVPIYYKNALGKRTQNFLMAEARVQAAEFLYALYDPLEAARLEVAGKLYRVTVERTRSGAVSASGVFLIAGPRKDDELVDSTSRCYTVMDVTNEAGKWNLTLRYSGRSAAPRHGEELRLLEKAQPLSWVRTVGNNARERTRNAAWLYAGTTPPKPLRQRPTSSPVAQIKANAAT